MKLTGHRKFDSYIGCGYLLNDLIVVPSSYSYILLPPGLPWRSFSCPLPIVITYCHYRLSITHRPLTAVRCNCSLPSTRCSLLFARSNHLSQLSVAHHSLFVTLALYSVVTSFHDYPFCSGLRGDAKRTRGREEPREQGHLREQVREQVRTD